MSGNQPDRAPGHVDEIERLRLGDRGRRVIDIRFDEARPGLQAKLLRQLPRRVDGWSGEIEAYDIGAALRQRQRVHAEVALQVQHAQAGHGPELGFLDGIEPAACPRSSRSRAYSLRANVDRHALVPVGAIEPAPVDIRRRFADARPSARSSGVAAAPRPRSRRPRRRATVSLQVVAVARLDDDLEQRRLGRQVGEDALVVDLDDVGAGLAQRCWRPWPACPAGPRDRWRAG